MGIETTTYRIRIGLFSMPIKCKFRLAKLVVSRASVGLVLRLFLCLSVLVLLGGDVETNPGPPKTQQKKSARSVYSKNF